MPPLIPKFRVPLEMGAHGFRTVEQDSEDEVDACVYAILATPFGSRLEESDFGVEDPTFEQLPTDLTEWVDQVGKYEPRATIDTRQDIETALIRVGVLDEGRGE